MKRRSWIPFLFVAIIVFGLVFYLVSHLHPVWENEKRQPSPQARADSSLALFKLYQTQGFPVSEKAESFRFWDHETGLVFTSEFFLRSLSKNDGAQLRQWIRTGGRLVVQWKDSAQTDLNAEGLAFVKDLGITEMAPSTRYHDQGYASLEAQISGRKSPLKVYLNVFRTFGLQENDSTELIGQAKTEDKYVFLQMQMGEGWVVLFNSGCLENDHLGKDSNALLPGWLANDLPDHKPILIAMKPANAFEITPSWVLILISLGMVALIFVTASVVRFGPAIQPIQDQRRSLLERLEAEGRFFWHHGLRLDLHIQVRGSFLAFLSRKFPFLTPLEQRTMVCQKMQLTDDQAKLLFTPPAKPLMSREFMALMTITEHARKVL